MSTITVLAAGKINATDEVRIELTEPTGSPPVILIHWPCLGRPSVAQPLRFGPVALAVIALMDEAMMELEKIRPDTQGLGPSC